MLGLGAPLLLVQSNGGAVFHATNAHRMGDDARSVIDAELRLRGVERVSVIDAKEISGGQRRSIPTRRTGGLSAAEGRLCLVRSD